MAAKAKAAFSGTHTAGIYADMTVDGPEIGTLVVIVDRAKNLPNRKSMGKQDPYCAARLGKEAKKTDTDKRGGQTPKWDQELRFTVHESPDYYQLKVSVFNDDKKTELIGETRIGLEDIIVPGGGQNDTWHSLHCKGRFAGEIRIELTYYDTRPKEEPTSEQQPDIVRKDSQDTGREAVGGPRGLKPPKRRPLPANPTEIPRPTMPEHSHSSPLPQSNPQVIHQPTPSYPNHYGHRDYGLDSTPPSGMAHQHVPQPSNIGSTMGLADYNPQWMADPRNNAHSYEQHYQQGHQTRSMTLDTPPQRHHERSHEQHAPRHPHQDTQRQYVRDDPYLESYQPRDHYTAIQESSSYDYGHPSEEQPMYELHQGAYSHSPPGMPHGNSMPDVRQHHNSGPTGHQVQRHSLPTGRDHLERPTVQQHIPNDRSHYAYVDEQTPDVDDDVPPPPPAHRSNSGVNPSAFTNGRSLSENAAPVPGPAPLNIRKERGSFSNSPLSQVQNSESHGSYAPSTSPSHMQRYTHPPSMIAMQHPEDSSPQRETYYRRSVSPMRNGQPMPLSLIPGQGPDSPRQMAPNTGYDGRMGSNQTSDYETIPRYQHAQTPTSQPRSQHATTIHAHSPLQAVEGGPERRSHRTSAPVVNPQGGSPDPRYPVRKPISPQPDTIRNERRGSDIPFSPDSYDAFNPYVSSDAARLSPGARYETPEQAREASVQHDREQRLGDGPIIGSDGRVIDPSDHLPTDTWAPEPEVKAPKKTAQVNIRFRNSPQGAQPMPRASPRVPPDGSARPASISTPTYTSNTSNVPDNVSPVAAARARLQKRTRVSPAQPNSSPAVPTVNTALQNPVLRSTASDYPLREHENYGYDSSPTYNRPSPRSYPPPVPTKVPIAIGQEDWRRDPLSEELSRIDIGVGGGRMRRGRYGG
ncbi:MAG: hypothetical protein Q9219_004207 [cf. Caloplaca sp. 3 TL-2023]